MSLNHKKILALSILIGLIFFWVGQYYSLSSSAVQVRNEGDFEYWRGTVDQKIVAGEDRDKEVAKGINEIKLKIDTMCNDITDVKIQATKNGALYGTGSSIVTYLAGLLLQFIVRRKK
jgi:hypothetical protein